MFTTFGLVASGLIGVGITLIGARFLLAPRTAAAGYGVPVEPLGLQRRPAAPTPGSM